MKQKLWLTVQFTLLFIRTFVDVSIRGTGKAYFRPSFHFGRWALSLVIKWPEQEADLSPPSSAEAESGAAPPLPYTLSRRGQGLQSSPHSFFI